MARGRVTFDTARQIARSLPDVEDGEVYRTPAILVGGKMFACIPNHRSAERGSLVLRLDFAQRDVLLQADPETYYLPAHYKPHPCVLVRLSRTTPETLRDLLQAAWTFVSHGERPVRRTTRSKRSP